MGAHDRARALRIGKAARAADLDPRTLRYYEGIGLVRPSGRTSAGYRLYTEREVEALRFVRRTRALGLSLREAGELLETWARGVRPCDDLDAILRRHLQEVDARVRELEGLRDDMRAILDSPRPGEDQEGICPKLATERPTEVLVGMSGSRKDDASGGRRRRVPRSSERRLEQGP